MTTPRCKSFPASAARLRSSASTPRRKQDASYHDMNELLTLLDMLERALTKEQGNGNEN
jgi:hypothetical protein